MSWLFGKKKHHKDSPEEEEPAEQGEQGDANDAFIFVEKRPAPPPPEPSSNTQVGGLYPNIGGPYQTTVTSTLDDRTNSGEAVHYLTDVPFKLCKRLESTMNSDLEIDRLRISEIFSFITRLENQNLEYTFSVEESVIAEMNSRNSE